MHYIVNISYSSFKFKDGSTALTFAELAKVAAVSDLSVGVEVMNDPPEEAEGDSAEKISYDLGEEEE